MTSLADRFIVTIACVLASGGWVCDNSVDNRCPGAVTCDIEIANVCCPLGSVDWCDGCSTNGCGTRQSHYCDDKARILDCSFNATIASATCDSPASTAHGIQYALHLSGTLSGCGQEGVQFVVAPDEATGASTSCGSWEEGVFGGCVSSSPETTTSHFAFSQRVTAGTKTVSIARMHGTAPPIATTTVICGT